MKAHAGEDPERSVGVQSAVSQSSGRGKLSEATDALIVLGYTKNEALNALKDINVDSMELEEIIRTSLKLLMKY